MASYLLILLGAVSVGLWGVMHILKTGPVVAGFEPLTGDNRYVLTMEWIVEGVSLVFAATLVAASTIIHGPDAAGSKLIYAISVGFLLTMAGVSLFTGARASPLPYKLCAPIFTSAALLIALGGLAL